MSFSASHDKRDHIVCVHTAKFFLPPKQDDQSLVPPVNGVWLLQTPKLPQVLPGRVLRGQIKNMPGMMLLVWMTLCLCENLCPGPFGRPVKI